MKLNVNVEGNTPSEIWGTSDERIDEYAKMGQAETLAYITQGRSRAECLKNICEFAQNNEEAILFTSVWTEATAEVENNIITQMQNDFMGMMSSDEMGEA